jgi:branched-chain amino acid transport system substrate-binding protein
MKRRLTVLTAALALFSLLMAACGAPSTSTQPQPSAGGASTTKTAIIGFTASITGKSNVESTRQQNGLQLWMDQIKAKGGLTLADGKLTFEARSYDDESNNERVQELYARLINEDKADFLISPYGSGPADTAAVLAEQYGKIMITTGAASDSTYKKGYTLVYQTYTPASRYLTGALDALAKLDPNAKKIAIVHENDKFSTDVVKALQTYAEGKGYQIVVFEGYDTSTTDFGPIINKVQQAQPDAILGGGHFQDGTTFAKQLAEKQVDAKFLALLVAPPEPKFAELGDSALGVVGPSQWEPLAAFTGEAAKAGGLEWYGPAGAEFVSAYKAAFGGEEPSYHAAGGYVAGLILQRAIEQAGSLDTKAVKEALDKLDILTFFGHIKFDTGAAHGLQIGHDMVYIQWQKDAGGKLAKQVIWPAEGATAKALYPIR